MTATHGGACFCGSVGIEAAGEPLEMGYRHCASCRLHSGAPLTPYISLKDEQVRVTRGAELAASERRDRQFCTRCGGALMTGHSEQGLTDRRAAVLPTAAFRPTVHLNYAEAVLLCDFSAEAGGSGRIMPE